jgi:Bax protein
MKSLSLCALLGVSVACWTGCARSPADARQTVTLASYKELQDFFQTYGYTFEIWRAGYRAVPRVYLTDVPEHWAKIADQVSLTTKKELFYSAILPIVLRANERIALDRARAEPLAMRLLAGQPISPDDRGFLTELAGRYEIQASSAADGQASPEGRDAAMLKEILLRVDTIPPSLALAQAAYESAYATSRFAGLGNALYGQHSKSGKGIKAQGSESQDGAVHMEDFESPLDCTLAYAHNLNTHAAYADFRRKRAGFRHEGKLPDPAELALTLTKYSERGEAYTHEIAQVIRKLNLNRADMAYLREMKPVYIVPKRKTP